MSEWSPWQQQVDRHMKWLSARTMVSRLVLGDLIRRPRRCNNGNMAKKPKPPIVVPPEAQLIGREQFAAMLGVSTKTLTAMRGRGELPQVVKLSEFSRSVRWRLADAVEHVRRLREGR